MNTAIYCESPEHSKEVEAFYLDNGYVIDHDTCYITSYNYLCLDSNGLAYTHESYVSRNKTVKLTLDEAKELIRQYMPSRTDDAIDSLSSLARTMLKEDKKEEVLDVVIDNINNTNLSEYVEGKLKELLPRKFDHIDTNVYLKQLEERKEEIKILKDLLLLIKNK